MSTELQFALGVALGSLAFLFLGPVIFLLTIKWMDFVADKIFKI
jgi:hypothetical protein